MSLLGRRGKMAAKKFLVFARVVLFFGAVADVMYTFVYILIGLFTPFSGASKKRYFVSTTSPHFLPLFTRKRPLDSGNKNVLYAYPNGTAVTTWP